MQGASDAPALTKAGHEALRGGDPVAARENFRRATATGQADATAWFGLAVACRALMDGASAVAAVERALALDPRHCRALVLRGDLYADGGNTKAASAFYAAALRHAPAGAERDPLLAAPLEHARRMCDRYAREYESFLLNKIAETGIDPARASSRFAQSLDLMMGRKKIYYQQPTQYYFPELPQIQFYDRGLFPWLDEIERATDDIVAELEGVVGDETAFRPYVEKVSDRPRPDDIRMTDNRDWTAFYLWKNGEIVAENAGRCPKTMKSLERVPHCRVAGRTPSILFSRLRPGARIPPHAGFINARLICHLPLIIPENCGFRVGNDVRPWQKGKAWVFDDTIEHEAWNGSAEMRVIMIFEIWRPELTLEERALVSALLQAIAAYDGQPASWSA